MTTDEKYQLVADDYSLVDLNFHNTYSSIREFEPQITSFCAHLKDGSTVLNIGGSRSECSYFADQKFAVTNIDVSQRIVDDVAADARINSLKASINTFTSSPSTVFNGAWACRSLFHIPLGELSNVLAKIYELTAIGGVFGAVVFTTEDTKPVEQFLPDPYSEQPNATYYRVLYPASHLKELFTQASFTLLKTEVVADQDGDKGVYLEALK